jgi:hypothetical protein
MDQGTLLNTISEQRNGALNQVAILQAQLATANKANEALQAQCDALNAKLQEVSKIRPAPKAAAPGKKRGRKPRELPTGPAMPMGANGADGDQSAFAAE